MSDYFTHICPGCGFLTPEGEDWHLGDCDQPGKISLDELKRLAEKAGVSLYVDENFLAEQP